MPQFCSLSLIDQFVVCLSVPVFWRCLFSSHGTWLSLFYFSALDVRWSRKYNQIVPAITRSKLIMVSLRRRKLLGLCTGNVLKLWHWENVISIHLIHNRTTEGFLYSFCRQRLTWCSSFKVFWKFDCWRSRALFDQCSSHLFERIQRDRGGQYYFDFQFLQSLHNHIMFMSCSA